jgi:thioredoxin reductase
MVSGKNTQYSKSYDILVAGGGIAGVAAAIASALADHSELLTDNQWDYLTAVTNRFNHIKAQTQRRLPLPVLAVQSPFRR